VEAAADLRAALSDAAARLGAAKARDELLAELITDRRTLFIRREPVLRPIGRVWRLGVLLLGVPSDRAGHDALRLYATGHLVRATAPGRTQYISASAETRRAYRAAAERGRIPKGETVNFDAAPISLDPEALAASSGPLLLREGRVLVRWSASATEADAREVRSYLDERVDLLAHPPEGA
jgi:hypothetical protein